MHRKRKHPMRVTVRDPCDLSNSRIVTVSGGRFQWALQKLIYAGCDGLTAADLPPGTAWNRYVHELRQLGIQIETVHERHGGEFPGSHGRFRLRSVCTVTNPEPESALSEQQRFGGAA